VSPSRGEPTDRRETLARRSVLTPVSKATIGSSTPRTLAFISGDPVMSPHHFTFAAGEVKSPLSRPGNFGAFLS